MPINETTISEFRRVSKVHEDWLVYTLVGPDLLTKGELGDLQLHGSLPLGDVLDLTTVSYYLGKKAAHLNTDAYKSLAYEDLTACFTDLERASIVDMRLRAATEIRRIAQIVSSTTQSKLQGCLTKGIQGASEDILKSVSDQLAIVAEESFAKAFTLFQNIYSLAVLDLIHVSKSHAQLNSMVQGEGIYIEGTRSQLMCQRGDTFVSVTAHDLMSKSLSGMDLHYVPPGTQFSEGSVQIVDSKLFEESIAKATAAAPAAPKPPTGSKTVSKPGSISGIPAPDQTAGPGAGGESVTNAPKTGVEYDDWRGAGEPRPPGEGWEQSTSGGWRHIKGAGGGVQSPQEDSEQLVQKQKEAIHYGKTPHKDSEVLDHLANGSLVSIKKLGTDEAGIHNTFRVTTEGGGRGLMKPVEHQNEDTHGNVAGTGYGSVPRNNSHGHEAAAYQAYTMFGLSACPPTTTRSYEGATHSMQAWAEDHLPTDVHLLLSDDMEEKNHTKALLNMVPADKRDDFKDSVMSMIAMDIVMNNNDGHRDNTLINKESDGIRTIDHADSFGTGMKGVRNDFHHDFHRAGMKVTIPGPMQVSMRNKTLGDYKRSVGGNLQDWQVGQTYLRAQYALHLQDTEGHLDFQKFLPTMDSYHGGNEFPMQGVRTGTDGSDQMTLSPQWRQGGKDTGEFEKRKEEKTLPNDLFESFAKKFINDNKDNPESPHHSAAKELDGLGVFMPPSAMGDPKAYRRTGGQHEYAKTIAARNPDPKIGASKNLQGSTGVDPSTAGTQADFTRDKTIREQRMADRGLKTVAKRPRRRKGDK